MDFLQYRVKNMEAFKDGNVLGGRFLKPGEILVISESDLVKIKNSGGTLEIIETLVPNPMKRMDKLVQEVLAEQEAEQEEAKRIDEAVKRQADESLQRAGEPAPKKRGRPKKAVDNAS